MIGCYVHVRGLAAATSGYFAVAESSGYVIRLLEDDPALAWLHLTSGRADLAGATVSVRVADIVAVVDAPSTPEAE